MSAGALEAALAEVEAALRRGAAPTRHDARALLVALGLALLEGREVSGPLERVGAWIAARPGPWGEALASEISMAVTEHVRGADPRWVGHPRYDWGYAVEARQRLEARLLAAERLGIGVPDELLEAVARADAVLAPHLERDQGHQGKP